MIVTPTQQGIELVEDHPPVSKCQPSAVYHVPPPKAAVVFPASRRATRACHVTIARAGNEYQQRSQRGLMRMMRGPPAHHEHHDGSVSPCTRHCLEETQKCALNLPRYGNEQKRPWLEYISMALLVIMTIITRAKDAKKKLPKP